MPSESPTFSTVRANLSRTGGRLSAQWNEILSILNRVLPGVIILANEQFELDLPLPQGFVVDGEKAPTAFPWVSVASNNQESQPMGDGFTSSDSNLLVHFHFASGHLDRLKLDALADLACLARACLYHYIGPHGDGDGRLFWDELLPSAISLGPGNNNSVGIAIHYRITTYPHSNTWESGNVVPISDPTPEQVLSYLPFCGGRLSLARNSILDIAQRELPRILSEMNEIEGLNLKHPIVYYALGEAIGNQLPALLVGVTCTTEFLGFDGPPMFADRVIATLYCLQPAGEDRFVLMDNADWANIAVALLLCYQQGYVDEYNRSAWTELTPASAGLARVPETQMSAATVRFNLFQGPQEERWVKVLEA